MLQPIAELNGLSASEFAEALKPLFEAAAPLAAALYAERPFASYADLIARAEILASGLPLAEQIEVINAHPRIGEPADRLSDLSRREQSYHQESPDVDAALDDLNAAYEQRFGFRFLVYVNKRPRSAIVEVLRSRLQNSRDTELRTALQDMLLIARHRLNSIAWRYMQPPPDNPARMAVLKQLRRSALETYGEERCAEATLQTALGLAATAIWRVSQEPLEPLDYEPFPTA
jgi:2-oxo-4-hydroxy-4-carboxy-5-ureidoimidazoline decarboxylase